MTGRQPSRLNPQWKLVTCLCPSSLLQVEQREQEKALAAALSDSLWLAGEEQRATVALVSEDYCITPHLDYKLDNFTEKVSSVRVIFNPLSSILTP